MRKFILIVCILIVLAGCSASPPEEAQPASLAAGTAFEHLVLPEGLPAINWMAIPLGAPEMDVLPGLGIAAGDIIDTVGGANASYGFWSETDTTPDLWATLNVSLAGVPLDHANVVCQNGTIRYVGYEFHLDDFSDANAFWTAMQGLRQGLVSALDGKAVFLGERGEITTEGCGGIYRAYWSDGAVQLELEILNDRICELRLTVPNN